MNVMSCPDKEAMAAARLLRHFSTGLAACAGHVGAAARAGTLLLGVVGTASATPVLDSIVYTRDASGVAVTDRVAGSGAASVQRTEVQASGGTLTSTLEGQSSAEFQTLRSLAILTIDSTVSGNSTSAKTESSFSKIVTVPGPVAGTQTRYYVPLKFDGSAAAGFGNAQQNFSFTYASTDIRLTYRVLDLDQLVPADGGFLPRQLMAFSYTANLVYDSRNDATIRAGWRGSSSNTPRVSGDEFDEYISLAGLDGDIEVSANTGQLQFELDTRVGNRLQITSSLDVFVQVTVSNGLGFASGEYQHTFDAGLISVQPGVWVDGERPGVFPGASPLPEPSTLALAGLMVGVAARRRRPASG